ncbi:LysR family transcriptional regulator [Massilia niastensis]|uniref:LysR family transcriptional regulator n=1 Tax=Massilia niastensis TaxID=544911 RepID=UPI00035D57FA|nr:LysR family transcriptional regulator [Massilia niastensis]
MDTRFIQSFLAVVESGSIAEAARRLDLAPTTVAQQIHALEADIGSKLLTRAGRTVKPTVVGTRIVERARGLVRDVRDLRSAASDTGLPAGPLRLGATPTTLMGLLPPLLRRWMQVHPDIPVYIEPGTSALLLDRMMSGELDAAILVHPAFDLPKTCAWRLLREESLILLTPSRMSVQDPLATAAREPFIRYDRNVVAGKMADEYLRAHGVRPTVHFELDGIEHISKLVAEGLGVSVLPDWPVIGAPDPQLRRWSLPSPCPARRVGMAWLRTSVRSQLAEEFVHMACRDQSEPGKQGRQQPQ